MPLLHPKTKHLVFVIAFHMLYAYSIIETYFKPQSLVYPLLPVPSNANPPAKRLFLFVADGLRADKAFEYPNRIPFLRTIIEHHGVWGVSHTAVPTESRVGHLALLCGVYESTLPIANSWNEDAVDYDSVFSQSQTSWAWGSPDVLHLFCNIENLNLFINEEEYQDFGHRLPSQLDAWVFNQVEKFFTQDVPNDPQLTKRLQNDKLVFFLHLLGIDTAGHAKHPSSSMYKETIELVDYGIEKITSIIENYYQHDGKTAYIFTADHGMSDIGTHGDGSPECTRVPFIAWGAGIRLPRSKSNYNIDKNGDAQPLQRIQFSKKIGNDIFMTPSNWMLDQWHRHDIRQGDIAVLMASLIGTPVPVHSHGILPLEYLIDDIVFKAAAIKDNAVQTWIQFLAYESRETFQINSWVLSEFKPFKPLVESRKWIKEIESEYQQENYEIVIEQCLKMIDLALEGLDYYRNYNQFLLKSIITLGYLGSIIFCITIMMSIIHQQEKLVNTGSIHSCGRKEDIQLDSTQKHAAKVPMLMIHISSFHLITTISIVTTLVWVNLWIRSLPPTYYFYTLFPISTWSYSILHWRLWKNIIFSNWNLVLHHNIESSHYQSTSITSWHHIFTSLWHHTPILLKVGGFCIPFIQLILLGFQYRPSFSLCFLFAAIIGYNYPHQHISKGLRSTWFTLCVLASIFPLVPIEFGVHTWMVVLSTCIVSLIPLWIIHSIQTKKNPIPSHNLEELVLAFWKQASSTTKCVLLEYRHNHSILSWKKATGWIQSMAATSIGLQSLFQFVLVILNLCNISYIDYSLHRNMGLGKLNMMISWGSLAISIGSLVIYSSINATRADPLSFLCAMFLYWLLPCVIFSISFEVIFITVVTCLGITWIIYEMKLDEGRAYKLKSSGNNNRLSLSLRSEKERLFPSFFSSYQPIRIMVIYLLLSFFTIFGTGANNGGVTFQLSSAFRFITVFSPFIMSSLLIFKTLIPFLLLSVIFSLLRYQMECAEQQMLSLLGTIFIDIMALTFFHRIEHVDSWQQIGFCIFCFVVVNCFLPFQTALNVLGTKLVVKVLGPNKNNNYKAEGQAETSKEKW